MRNIFVKKVPLYEESPVILYLDFQMDYFIHDEKQIDISFHFNLLEPLITMRFKLKCT